MTDGLRMEHVPDDVLLDIAHGVLSGRQRTVCLEHVRSCTSCERRFVEICRDREVGRLGPPDELADARSRDAGTPRRRVVAVAAIAAVAAALVVTAILLPRRSSGVLEPDWLPAQVTDLPARGAPECVEPSLALDAVAAYRAHDAARVAQVLAGRDLREGCGPLRLIYASALIHVNDAPQALAILEELDVESLPQPARDRGRWLRALALDRLGARREVDRILRDLASRPGEYQQRAAAVVR